MTLPAIKISFDSYGEEALSVLWVRVCIVLYRLPEVEQVERGGGVPMMLSGHLDDPLQTELSGSFVGWHTAL